jgi:hypothetical protein
MKQRTGTIGVDTRNPGGGGVLCTDKTQKPVTRKPGHIGREPGCNGAETKNSQTETKYGLFW